MSELAQTDRLMMFLEILSAMGGQSDASDYSWNWVNAFCEAHEGRNPDTFNLAHDLRFTTVSHDSDTDQSNVYLTAAGRAALDARKAMDTRHKFTPHRKWPWFCRECGYAPHEQLKHIQEETTRPNGEPSK